jgi:hypothetical protein
MVVCQVLDVHLVHDAGAGRHHLELVEGGLAPAQELVALAVAAVLDLDVALEGVRAAEDVGDHRVVDHQLGRGQRVDLGRVAAQLGHRLAHRGQVHHAGHAGEILQHHARGHEGNFRIRLGLGVPLGDRLDFLGGDRDAVLVAQQVFQQDFHRIRQLLQVEALAELGEAGDLVRAAVDLEGVAGGE